ncbi:MAG: hypothetical protein ACTSPI_01275 [Candidatus Heimdallarchaeaceae archaeon]
MEKLEFGQKIIDVLIEAGYFEKGQIANSINILLKLNESPEVTVKFQVT